MSSLSFSEKAFEDYLYWQSQDRKTLKRVNDLLKDIQRDAFRGKGKPEALKGNRSGYWSRRIDDANRIIYCVSGDTIIVASCKGHYD